MGLGRVGLCLACVALLHHCIAAAETAGTCEAHDETCNELSKPSQDTAGLAMLQTKTAGAKIGSSDSFVVSEAEAEEAVEDGPPLNPTDWQGVTAKDNSVHPSEWYRVTKARFDAKASDGQEGEEEEESTVASTLQMKEGSEEGEDESSEAYAKTLPACQRPGAICPPNCSFMGPVPEPLTSCGSGGRLYEGACWYVDNSKSSLHDCNTVCGKRGLEYDAMTRYVGGDCGTAYKCSQLGHLFNMPGDAMKGLGHERDSGVRGGIQGKYDSFRKGFKDLKFDSSVSMGCLIYDRGMKQSHIVSAYEGDWFEMYKSQGVSWMPGKKPWQICDPKYYNEWLTKYRNMKFKGKHDRQKYITAYKKNCDGHKLFLKGTDMPTDAVSSPNMGPPTRVCACKPKTEDKCVTHGECTSGFCDGAPAAEGSSSAYSFLPQAGNCRAARGTGEACSIHQGCKSGYCNTATKKCDKVSWSVTNGAAVNGHGRLFSKWCKSNGPDGCAIVLSMVGAGIKRNAAIAQAQSICASIDDCNSVWCCTTGCTNAICYATSAKTPNYKQKDCPGLKGSFLESKIPVQMWTINRPASHVVAASDSKAAPQAGLASSFLPTVPYPFTKVKLDWTGVQNQKNAHCYKACGNRGGFCDYCGAKGACCQAGFISWELGAAYPGCDEAITRSAGHSGFGCVPQGEDRPKRMHDANTGEAITFLPMEERFKLPPGAADSWLGASCKKMAKYCKGCCKGAYDDGDLSGINFQVLLKGYQCGPDTDTYAKTYHNYNTAKENRGWKTAKSCLTAAKEAGAKAVIWSPGWTGREKGLGRFISPSYNCVIEATKDATCPEGFTKTTQKGEWFYIQILPDGPRPNIDGSLVLLNITDKVTKAAVHQALADSAGVKLTEIDVVDFEKHAGGGWLVQFVGSVPVVTGILEQLDDPNSKLAMSPIGSHISFPDSPPAKRESPVSPPRRPPRRGGKGKGRRGRMPQKRKAPPATEAPPPATEEEDEAEAEAEAEAEEEEEEEDEDEEEAPMAPPPATEAPKPTAPPAAPKPKPQPRRGKGRRGGKGRR